MSYLEYNFVGDKEGVTVNDFLEKHSKQKNLWWKSLSGINNLYKTHIDIFKQNAKGFFSKTYEYKGMTPKTVKSCPAIGDAFLNKVFLVKAPCDIFLSVTNDQFYYQIPDNDWLSIESHSQSQFHTEENNIFEGYINIKFKFPLKVRAANNPIMWLDPQYHTPDNGIKVLTGVIDAKYQPQELNINTLIKLDDLQKDFFIKKGTVLCYLWIPEELELKHNPNLYQKPRSSFFAKYL